MSRSFIAIGSNIDPDTNVRAAIRALAVETRVVAISTIYKTDPESRSNQPSFYNGVVEIETDRAPHELKFGLLRAIEAGLGRRRTSDKDAARSIDLDLLLYDDLVHKAGGLVLPDPDIIHRSVIAIPLADLAPELVLPGMQTSMATLATRLSRTGMNPLTAYTEKLRQDAGLDLAACPLPTNYE